MKSQNTEPLERCALHTEAASVLLVITKAFIAWITLEVAPYRPGNQWTGIILHPFSFCKTHSFQVKEWAYRLKKGTSSVHYLSFPAS